MIVFWNSSSPGSMQYKTMWYIMISHSYNSRDSILIPGSDRLLELFAFTFRYYKIRHFSNFGLIYLEKGRIFAAIEIIIYIVWYEFSGKGNWRCMFLRFVAGLICGWKIYSAYVARSGCNCGPRINKPFDLPEWPKPWCKLHPLHHLVLYRRQYQEPEVWMPRPVDFELRRPCPDPRTSLIVDLLDLLASRPSLPDFAPRM